MHANSRLNRRDLFATALAAGAAVTFTTSTRGLGALAQETAPTPPAWIVNADGVNLRSAPGLQSEVVAVVNSGDLLIDGSGEPVSGDGHLWLNVTREADGTSGWVAADFVNPLNGNDGPPVGTILYVTLDNANLRETPYTSAAVVSQLRSGEITVIIGPPQGAEGVTWYNVQAGIEGQWTGWIDSTVLSEGDPPPNGDFEPGTVVTVTADALNLRADPSPNGAVIATYPYRTEATVIAVANALWVEVELTLDGAIGFFHVDFLAAGDSAEYVTVTNGPLSVRAEAGLAAAVVDSMETGETASLQSGEIVDLDGYSWIPVTVSQSGTQGWVALEFTDYSA